MGSWAPWVPLTQPHAASRSLTQRHAASPGIRAHAVIMLLGSRALHALLQVSNETKFKISFSKSKKPNFTESASTAL